MGIPIPACKPLTFITVKVSTSDCADFFMIHFLLILKIRERGWGKVSFINLSFTFYNVNKLFIFLIKKTRVGGQIFHIFRPDIDFM